MGQDYAPLASAIVVTVQAKPIQVNCEGKAGEKVLNWILIEADRSTTIVHDGTDAASIGALPATPQDIGKWVRDHVRSSAEYGVISWSAVLGGSNDVLSQAFQSAGVRVKCIATLQDLLWDSEGPQTVIAHREDGKFWRLVLPKPAEPKRIPLPDLYATSIPLMSEVFEREAGIEVVKAKGVFPALASWIDKCVRTNRIELYANGPALDPNTFWRIIDGQRDAINTKFLSYVDPGTTKVVLVGDVAKVVGNAGRDGLDVKSKSRLEVSSIAEQAFQNGAVFMHAPADPPSSPVTAGTSAPSTSNTSGAAPRMLNWLPLVVSGLSLIVALLSLFYRGGIVPYTVPSAGPSQTVDIVKVLEQLNEDDFQRIAGSPLLKEKFEKLKNELTSVQAASSITPSQDPLLQQRLEKIEQTLTENEKNWTQFDAGDLGKWRTATEDRLTTTERQWEQLDTGDLTKWRASIDEQINKWQPIIDRAANGLNIQNDKGTELISAAAVDAGGAQFFFNSDGKMVVYAGAGVDKTGLVKVFRKEGGDAISLHVDERGNPSQILNNTTGQQVIILGADESSHAYMALNNRSGKLRTRFQTNAFADAYLELYSRRDKRNVYLGGENSTGNGLLSLSTSAGEDFASIRTDSNGNGQLLLKQQSGWKQWPPPEKAGDIAEYVAVEPGATLRRGDVAELSGFMDKGAVARPSSTLGSTRILGIVSGAGDIETAITLNEQLAKGGIPIALAGTVYANATTACGAIATGDLLIASSRPGQLCRAVDPKPGSIVARAIEPLPAGEGLIRVWVGAR